MDVVREVNLFLRCLEAGNLDRGFDHLNHVERAVADNELVRLDSRKVENVRNERQKHFTGASDHRDELALRRRESAVREHLSDGNHSIQRRPNFVAHIREELALRFRRSLGLGRLLTCTHLGSLTCEKFRNVALDADIVCELPSLVENWREAQVVDEGLTGVPVVDELYNTTSVRNHRVPQRGNGCWIRAGSL